MSRSRFPKSPRNRKASPGYWVKTLFIASVSTAYQVNALVSTYVRLVEAALVEYRMAEPKLREFWGEHHSVKLSATRRFPRAFLVKGPVVSRPDPVRFRGSDGGGK